MKSRIAKIVLGCAFALGMSAFVGCGDDSGSNSSKSDQGVSDVVDLELANGKAVVCDDDMEGVVAITKDDGYRKCVDGEWVKITRREAMEADDIIGQIEDDDEDDSSSSSVKSSSSGVVPSDVEESSGSGAAKPMDYSAETYDDIPSCTAKREGSTVLVEDTGKKYVCEDGEWIALQTKETFSSSSMGSSSSSVSRSSSSLPPIFYPESQCDEMADQACNVNNNEQSQVTSSFEVVGNLTQTVAMNGEIGTIVFKNVSNEPQRDWNIYFVQGTYDQDAKTYTLSGKVPDYLADGTTLSDKFTFEEGVFTFTLTISEHPESSADEESSSSKGGSSVIYECDDGTIVVDAENCEQDKSSSSSVVVPGSDPESQSIIKADGYYKTNCPAGKTCSYVSTEYLNSSKTYGEFLDTRDYQVYKTVTIGTQTWMAQNLNYAYTGVPYNYDGYTSDSTSWCYKNAADSCAKYGRLYTWAAAIDSVALAKDGNTCGYGKTCDRLTDETLAANPVQGVCPSGWHLPSSAEWDALRTAAGGSSTAGKALKSTSGWYSDGNGTDASGFSALPAGYRYDVGSFLSAGYVAYFWSSTEYNGDIAYSMDLFGSYEGADLLSPLKVSGYSIRCIKNSNSSVIPDPDPESSSEAVVSSSSVIPGSDPESQSVIKADGYYKTNCPSGKTCSYVSTEYLNSSKTYGEFLDTRDYQVYKTVTIGTQTWMAQNLNYAYTGVPYSYSGYTSDSTSWCYNNVADSCAKYGRLYTWAASIDSVALAKDGYTCGYGKTCDRLSETSLVANPIRGVCPSGWHLPSYAEWDALRTAEGGSSTAGKALKSASGWYSDGNGTDAYGFSALPAGNRDDGGDFNGAGYNANFWSASQDENLSDGAYYMFLSYDYEFADLGLNYKGSGSSIRCIKND